MRLSILTTLLFLLNSSGSLKADNWDEFAKYMGKHYYLDKQEFDSLSCDIVIPQVNDFLAQVKVQLKPFEKNINIESNLDSFSLHYSKDRGFTFIKPTFNIIIISTDGLNNKSMLESGIEKMKNGLNQQIEGTIQSIQGLFDDYIFPSKSEYELEAFEMTKDSVIVSYSREGNEIVDIYKEHYCFSKLSGVIGTIKSSTSFISVGSKWIQSKIGAYLENGLFKMDMQFQIEYQKKDGIHFPAKMFGHFVQSMQDTKIESKFETMFINLKIY